MSFLARLLTCCLAAQGARGEGLSPLRQGREPDAADSSAAQVRDPRFQPPLDFAERELWEASQSGTGPEALARAGAAKAWRDALRRAAVRATPMDSTALAVSSRGGVWLTRGGLKLPAQETGLLRENDALETGRDGYLSLRFEDGARLTLGPDTSLALRQLPRPGSSAMTLFLPSGRVLWETARHAPIKATLLTPTASAQFHSGAVEASVDAAGLLNLRALGGAFEARSNDAPAANEALWWQRAY